MIARRLALLTALLAVLLAACEPEGGEREPEAVERWDSAGVEIVENQAPAWGDGQGWSIDPDPTLEIGVLEGEGPYEFSFIWDAARFPDSRLAVVDRAREIRVFDPEGRHLASLGGEGEGPGEFRDTPVIRIAPPDTILAWDPVGYRLSRFSPEAGLLRDDSFGELVGDLGVTRLIGGRMWEVAGEGTLLVRDSGREEAGSDRIRSYTSPILIRDGGERVIRVETFFSRENHRMVRDDGVNIQLVRPFPPQVRAEVAPDGSHLAVARGEAWNVEFFDDDGELVRIVRAAVPRKRVTPEMVEEQRAQTVEGTGLTPTQVDEAYQELGISDSIPAIANLKWDTEGNLWAGRRTAERGVVHEYDVIDSDGRWLGFVSLPEGVGSVHEIGDDYLLATWTGELDVHYLRKYRLRKP